MEHCAVEVDGEMVAMCRHDLKAGDKTHCGVWVVRERRDGDCICGNCELRLKWRERKEEPAPLPCTEPDKCLGLFVRDDGGGAVHVAKSMCASRCGIIRSSFYNFDRWIYQPGTAGAVTCERCLKAAGLYEGHVSRAERIEHAAFEKLQAWTGSPHPRGR